MLVVAEHNTTYTDESNKVAGHLWGDAAAALLITKEKPKGKALEIIDIHTGGAGNLSKSFEGVVMQPQCGGLIMNNGRDVFIQASTYMSSITIEILKKNGYNLQDLSYLAPHQANFRITKRVVEELGITMDKALSNVQRFGNTGCVGSALCISENFDAFKENELIVTTVFGGGYSFGAALLKVVHT